MVIQIKTKKGTSALSTGLILPTFTNRGYTGHEHIDEMGLIHMNGRVYDPVLGRFLSADPNIQAPIGVRLWQAQRWRG